MALTYQQITRNALLKLGVLDEHQAPSDLQVQDGIRELNELLREWEETGDIDLGFVPGSLPSDTVSIPSWAERAVTYGLGTALAADYHIEPSPGFMANHTSSQERLWARTLGDMDANLSYAPQGQTKRRTGGTRGSF